MSYYLLAIDQGTTNSRAIIFNRAGEPISLHEMPLTQYFPQDGWVEHNPQELYQNTITCCQQALKKAALDAKQIAAIGIANQRETTIIWNRYTGVPIYSAIVWQDRRTSEICQQLVDHPIYHAIQTKTGLILDPYFSATKIMWLLNNVPHAREQAECGNLLFGTVETFLLWKLTKGNVHITDITNASRTLLFNIHTQTWDQAILQALTIPSNLLPKVYDNTAYFGELDKSILGVSIPITGMAGDQQAAAIGQACFKPGMLKVTYGTGGFLLLNTGKEIIKSKNRLLNTIAYRINNQIQYGLEGSIFSAGATVKWLRDELHLIATSQETEKIASSLSDNGGIYFAPAFTGLGAPYWNPDARAAIFGIVRNTNKKHIVRAALECVAYQTRDLLEAMRNDLKASDGTHSYHTSAHIDTLRVDGGMTANAWLLQFIANILALPIERPACVETTALGVAYLAGLHVGIYQSLDEIAAHWQCDVKFKPNLIEKERETLYQSWLNTVYRII